MRMNMNRRSLVIFAAFLAGLCACATPSHQGPGMTVTFNNGLKGKSILFDRAVTASGMRFPDPGFLAPDTNPLRGGKTMGAAPDSRELPEQVEFTWRETKYQGDYTYEQLKALPRKTARVTVRSRIPQDVVDEVMESNLKRQPHKLAEKSLWVYFIWYESGIKFRWELRKNCCGILRAGGDDVGG